MDGVCVAGGREYGFASDPTDARMGADDRPADPSPPETGLLADDLARVIDLFTAGSMFAEGALGIEVAVLWRAVGAELHAGAFWSAPGVDVAELEAATASVNLTAGELLPGQAWAAQRPVAVADLTHGPYFVRREAAVRAGMRSAFAVPLVSGGDVPAVLECYAPEVLDVGDPRIQALAARCADLVVPLRAHAPLTAREQQVLQLAAGGLTSSAIAARLQRSPHTVKRHLENIYAKWDVPDRAAAVAQGIRTGVIE